MRAINALLEHTYSRFRLLARRMLRGFPGLRGELETDDVLHQSLADLKEALNERTPQSSKHFLNFAAEVMRHNLIDLARQLRRRPKAGSGLAQIPGAGAGPEDLAQRSEVHEVVGRLPERLRRVVELHLYQGLTYAEAALELGFDEKTIQRDWAKALCLLDAYLNRGGQ
jgi:RNA polymerase sigma factor (sigma-70 family)